MRETEAGYRIEGSPAESAVAIEAGRSRARKESNLGYDRNDLETSKDNNSHRSRAQLGPGRPFCHATRQPAEGMHVPLVRPRFLALSGQHVRFPGAGASRKFRALRFGCTAPRRRRTARRNFQLHQRPLFPRQARIRSRFCRPSCSRARDRDNYGVRRPGLALRDLHNHAVAKNLDRRY